MTEEEIRYLAEKFKVVPDTGFKPGSFETPGAFGTKRSPTAGALSQGMSDAERRRIAQEREQVRSGLSPMDKAQGVLEAGAMLGTAIPSAIAAPFVKEFTGTPEEEFINKYMYVPRTEAGLLYAEEGGEGIGSAIDAISESKVGQALGPVIEKIPGIYPVSGATTRAIDTGLSGIGKGTKLAAEVAGQKGRQILDEGQDLLQAARADFAAPPTGAIQLQAAQAPRSQLGMYSNAEQAALNLPQAKGTGNQFLAQLSKTPGVKPAELEWTGLSDFLKGKGEQPVTKAEIEQYLQANKIQVNERQLLMPSDFQARINNEIMPGNESIWASVDEDGVLTFKQMEPFTDRYLGEIRRDDLPDDIKSDLDDFLKSYGMAKYSPEDERYENYTTPGGSNYREILLKLPNVGENISFEKWVDKYTAIRSMDDLKRDPRVMKEMRARYERDLPRLPKEGTFRSGHFDDPNIISHMRVTDRNDADGKKVLFVEELQSDWGQSGREHGFAEKPSAEVSEYKKLLQDYEQGTLPKDKSGRFEELYAKFGKDFVEKKDNRSPSAPFVTNTEDWLNLSVKRLITDAVNNGYDKVAFIDGAQSAKRYDFSKQVDSIYYIPDSQILTATKDGNTIFSQKNVPKEKLASYVGKDAAERLIQSPSQRSLSGNSFQQISGDDLKVGGEGMKKFYDQIVPNTVNKLLKKLGGGKLEPINLVDSVNKPSGAWLDEATQKWDARVGDESFGLFDSRGKALEVAREARKKQQVQQLGFTITPEMRELVKSQGLPMFAKGGAVKGIKGGIDAAKQASKAARRQERVDKNLQRWSGSEEKPTVYYHATSEKKNFGVFDPEKSGSQAKASFFSSTPEFPNEWIKNTLKEDYLKDYPEDKPRNIPVRLRVKNTFDYENPEHVQSVISRAKIPKAFTPEYVADRMKAGEWAVIEDRNIQNAIRDQGFDSFFVKERGAKNIGVYNPGDIKSVFNRGSYSEDPDISKAEGGMVSADQIRERLKNAFNFAGGGKVDTQPTEEKQVHPFLARLRGFKKGGVIEGAKQGVKAASKAAKSAGAAKKEDKPAYSPKVLESTTVRMEEQIRKENPKLDAAQVRAKAERQAKQKLGWEREEKPALEKIYGELKKAPYSATLTERKQNVPEVVQRRIEETERFLAEPTEPWQPPRKELQAFDRERIKDALEGFPGIEQTKFPRYAAPRSGALGMMEEIYQDPVNRRLIEGQIKRGLPLGGETFYASLYPLKLAALERGIPESQFNQFVYSIAPASARNSIMNEMAVGQFLRDMNARGLPLDEDTVRKEMDRFKQQYGTGLPLMLVHREGVKNVLEGNLDLREMSKANIPTSYKIPTYGTQKAGDFGKSMVLDVHEAAGQTRGSKYHPYFTEQGGFSQTEYGPAEEQMLQIAQGLGIPGGMAQAGRWFGGGELTGLKSPRGDALDLLEKQAAYTLQGQGINPTPRAIRNFVLDMVETGRGELMPYFKKTPMPDYRTEKKKGGLVALER